MSANRTTALLVDLGLALRADQGWLQGKEAQPHERSNPPLPHVVGTAIRSRYRRAPSEAIPPYPPHQMIDRGSISTVGPADLREVETALPVARPSSDVANARSNNNDESDVEKRGRKQVTRPQHR